MGCHFFKLTVLVVYRDVDVSSLQFHHVREFCFGGITVFVRVLNGSELVEM